MRLEELERVIKQRETYNSWGNAVKDYALELVARLREAGYNKLDAHCPMCYLLDGAVDWRAYSYGGCSLIYEEDIACTIPLQVLSSSKLNQF